MKRILFLFLLCTSLAFSQNDWQTKMFDRSANFFDIVADFEIYKKQIMGSSKTIPKGAGIKQFERWRYYWESRVDVNGNFPENGHVLNEMNQYYAQKGMQLGSNQKYAQGNGNWELVGPIQSPVNGTGQMNGNGRVNCIAFHPTEPNTIFVGAPAGGLWKSTDNGQTWNEFSNGLTRLGVSSIVVHPTNPNTIYIGTGDRDSGNVPGYGVWRTTDGGLNWSPYNTGIGNKTINEVIMDSSNPDIMLAAASNGYVYRTINGGLNWTASSFLGVNPKDIAYHPTNPNIVYAGGTSMLRSTDGGVNWSSVIGVPTGVQRIAIATSIDQPDWVYALAGGSSGLVGIYRSENSGVTFNTRTTTPNILGYPTDGSDNRSQAYYDLVIAADPTNANTIYTGAINLWKSTDGGSTMNCVSYWVGPTGGVDGVHADQHALEFSPHTNVLFNGNDGGVNITSDEGTNWEDISSGLAIAQVYKIGVSQTVQDFVINGYQDNGTGLLQNGNFVTEIGGDGMECIIDSQDETYLYGALYYGDIRRSSNGGTSFSGIAGSIPEGGSWVTPYKLDHNNTNIMYAGYDNIWKNINVRNSSTWLKISNFGGTSNIRDIAIAPSNSDVMYVARFGNTFWKTMNLSSGSPTWTNLTANLPVGDEPKDIEIDPSDPDHVFVAIGNNIYESTNGGTSWTDISGTLPNISLNTIVIDHESTIEAMYVGMDVGVYYRDNTMSDWTPYLDNLPNIEITELEIQYFPTDCSSKLYAGTYAQGLWKSDLKDPGSIEPLACFKSDKQLACLGSVIKFTDNSDFTPTSWTWNITPATFNYVNGTDANSQNPEVEFTSLGTYTVELTATNGTGSNIETKPSYITITDSFSGSTFIEDFESETLCATTTNCGATVCSLTGKWINSTNGVDDDIDWRIDESGTPSAGTGPTIDYNPGTAICNYIYLEASGGCVNQTAILESQCIDLDQDYIFSFAYHMYGINTGSLHLDINTNGGWVNDIIPAKSEENVDAWQVVNVDLTAYTGTVIKLRFRGVTGVDFESDIALDDLKFETSLSTDSFIVQNNEINLYTNENGIQITSENKNLESVIVYDVLGRLHYQADNINFKTLEIKSIQPKSQVLFAKIKLANGTQVVKKLIY